MSLIADPANITQNAGNVAQWSDTSGGAHHFTQPTGGSQPPFVATSIHGRGAVRFIAGKGMSCVHTAAAVMSGATSGERFILGQIDTDDEANILGANWGTSGQGSYIQYLDGTIFDEFLSTTRQNTPVVNGVMTSPFIQDVQSAAGAWTLLLNGVQKFTTATNIVGISASPFVLGAAVHLNIRAILVYDHVLSAPDRAIVMAGLATL